MQKNKCHRCCADLARKTPFEVAHRIPGRLVVLAPIAGGYKHKNKISRRYLFVSLTICPRPNLTHNCSSRLVTRTARFEYLSGQRVREPQGRRDGVLEWDLHFYLSRHPVDLFTGSHENPRQSVRNHGIRLKIDGSSREQSTGSRGTLITNG